jgi:hypothetical protein
LVKDDNECCKFIGTTVTQPVKEALHICPRWEPFNALPAGTRAVELISILSELCGTGVLENPINSLTRLGTILMQSTSLQGTGKSLFAMLQSIKNDMAILKADHADDNGMIPIEKFETLLLIRALQENVEFAPLLTNLLSNPASAAVLSNPALLQNHMQQYYFASQASNVPTLPASSQGQSYIATPGVGSGPPKGCPAGFCPLCFVRTKGKLFPHSKERCRSSKGVRQTSDHVDVASARQTYLAHHNTNPNSLETANAFLTLTNLLD